MAPIKNTHSRWTTALAAAASLAIATSAFAQATPPTAPPAAPQAAPPATPQAAPQAAPQAVNGELAKQHLTAARNALNEITQLPAASQLAGEPRNQVQQLISNFNELITTNSNWRASYAKVEANVDNLLAPETPAPASGTAGAVGTSGTTATLDPAIRAKLVEFREHLGKFEEVAGGAAPSPAEPPPATAATAAPPATMAAGAVEDKPDSPPDADNAQEITIVPQDVLVHVEAVEVILGAQAAAQKTATAGAGGAVTSSQTTSGSTRTTIAGPDVTLNPSQLDQIKTHLSEIKRLLEKK